MRSTVTPPSPQLLAQAFPERTDLDAAGRVQHFFATCWRQRALFMPGAARGLLPDFDADELAGLACEDGADARIVTRTNVDPAAVETRFGPFDAAVFDALGDADWSLLVNGVDLEVPGFQPLLDALVGLPRWRLDDVMVSFAAPGGGVGPHYDQYDVFLVQAMGTRRWHLSTAADGPSRPQSELPGARLVRDFVADFSVDAEPGDVLYVPPGVVHDGVALTPTLTLSVGLRAPSRVLLADDWLQQCLAQQPDAPAELDPVLPTDEPDLLDDQTLARARAEISTLLQACATEGVVFDHWLGGALTAPGRAGAPEPQAPLHAEAVGRALAGGQTLVRMPGTRMLWRAESTGQALYAAGEHYPTAAAPTILRQLCANEQVDAEIIDAGGSPTQQAAGLALVTALYNAGVYSLQRN